MTDAAPTPDGQPTVDQAALAPDPAATNGTGPTSAGTPAAATLPQLPAERPELAVGAAFAGGFVLALLLKRLAR